MTRRATDNTKALDAFLAAKAEIDAMLARLPRSATTISTPTPTRSTGAMSAPSSTTPARANHRQRLQRRRARRVREPRPWKPRPSASPSGASTSHGTEPHPGVLDGIEASLREDADIPARLTADSMTIAIDVATDRLPDAAALLRELGLI